MPRSIGVWPVFLMRILRVIDTLNPRTGGPAMGVRSVTPVLRDLGHETVIATVDSPEQPAQCVDGADVIALGPARGSYRFSQDLRVWLLRNVHRFDVVVVHGLWQSLGRSVHLATRDNPVPYFVYPHGMLDPWFRRAYPGKHAKKWLYWLMVERHVLGDASAVLFTCEEERRLARKSFAPYYCVERVVNYGTAAAPDDEALQIATWHKLYPALRHRPFLLFLGRIHPKKGIDLLLEAYATLASQTGTPPALVIAGPSEDPELLRRLQTLAANLPERSEIIWTGLLEGAAKWGALRTADAFVLPSHQENFGLAVVEALSVGTPVLISKQVNIWREIVADGAGFASDDTVAGTTELLAGWHALPTIARTGLRSRAAKCYRERFDVHSVAHSFVTTVQSFLQPTATVLAS